MAGRGGRVQRFTRLQRETALRLVSENFGVIDELILDRIEHAIGRRPKRQAVDYWVHGRKPKKKASSPRVGVDASVSQQTSMSRNDGNVFDIEKSLVEIPVEQPGADSRSTVEKLEFSIDALLDLTKTDLAKLATDKRLRLVPQLFETWAKLRQLDPAVLAVAPLVREFLAVVVRKGVEPVSVFEDMIASFEELPDAMTVTTPRTVAQSNSDPLAAQDSVSEKIGAKE